MAMIINDPALELNLRRRRKRAGADRYDEVWDGVYVMAAMPNNEHQDLAGDLVAVLKFVIQYAGRGRVFPGVNISDQPKRWKRNYRCPDVAVYLSTNPAEDRGTHWFGGPDFAVEIVSPGEDPFAKIDFYAKVGTRELLVVGRDPWQLSLFHLRGEELKCVATSGVAEARSGSPVISEVVPFTWRLLPRTDRPRIEMTCTETGQTWNA